MSNHPSHTPRTTTDYQAIKRYTAVTRGGACRYEDEYVAGLKDRELSKAINGCVSVGVSRYLSARSLYTALL